MRATIGLTSIGLLGLLLLTACGKPEEKEARYLRLGNALFDKGAYEKARVEYKNAAREKPADAEPIYKFGMVDEAEGDLRGAFVNFLSAEQQNGHFHPAVLKIAQYLVGAEQFPPAQKRIAAVLAEAPADAEAHAIYASLLLHQNDDDRAEKEARVALTYDPNNISAFAVLTGLYSDTGQFDKAVATVNDGIVRNPNDIALLMLRVMVYGHMNDLPKIAEAYQAVFKLKPDITKFRVDLASIYVKAGKPDEAEAVLRQGVADRPDDWNMKHELVIFLGTQRGIDVAEKEIKGLMQGNPQNDDLYFWLADLYITHDATDRAYALLNQIIEREPFSQSALNARNRLARIDFKRGNKELAEKLVAAVLAKAPDDSGALLIRANLAFDNGYYQNAVSDLRTILRDKPLAQDALRLLSETFLLQGHYDLAVDTMAKLVDLNSSDLAARVRLAQMVNLNGNPRQALELIAQVTKQAPDYAIGWETAARIAIDGREWLAAEEAIRALDKLDGQHLTAAYLEGQILAKNGKDEEAIAKFTEVANADPATPLAEHALLALTDAYRKLGRMPAACGYIETLKSGSALVSTLLGNCYAATGRLADGARMFDQAIAAKTTSQDAYLGRAGLYVKDRKPDMAIDILKQGALAAPTDFRAPMMEADLLGKTGKYSDAIALYNNILDHNSAYDPAANNLAEMIADDRYDDAAALEKARQAAERFAGSTDPMLLDTLAWVYFRQGKNQLAQTILERVTLKSGVSLPPQIHYHYGAILMKEGKVQQAKSELRLATPADADYAGLEEAKKLLARAQGT